LFTGAEPTQVISGAVIGGRPDKDSRALQASFFHGLKDVISEHLIKSQY